MAKEKCTRHSVLLQRGKTSQEVNQAEVHRYRTMGQAELQKGHCENAIADLVAAAQAVGSMYEVAGVFEENFGLEHKVTEDAMMEAGTRQIEVLNFGRDINEKCARRGSPASSTRPPSHTLNGLGHVKSVTYGMVPTLMELTTLLEWRPYDFELRGTDAETARRVGVQLKGPLGPSALHKALVRLTNAWNRGDDEAGNLASVVLESVGIEWI